MQNIKTLCDAVFDNHMKSIFRLPWQSQLSAELIFVSDFVEPRARNMLSFIQVGQEKDV